MNPAVTTRAHLCGFLPPCLRGTGDVSALRGGGSYSGKADEINYSEYDWYATDYGCLNTKFRCDDGTYDYAKIESINASSDYGAQLVMTQIDGRLNTYGITSIFSHEASKGFEFYGGIDVKYYYCSHTNRIIDLFGGDYYIDPCRKEVLLELILLRLGRLQ